jgi:hypothetical protein
VVRETLLLCDFGQGSCRQRAHSYRVWRDGDKTAWALDLCDEHAEQLLLLVRTAEKVELPTKQRVKLEATQLRTTSKTAHLKKKE